MKRYLFAFTIALGAVSVLHGQDIKSTTTIKAGDARTVVYSGCVATGAESKSYVLENAVPVKTTKTDTKVGSSGMPETTTTTTTGYVLVPGGQVDLQQNIGHKVEVTAVMIPAGDDHTKVETRTKTQVEGQPTEKTETKDKVAQNSWPQLKVMSVKHLADRCQP